MIRWRSAVLTGLHLEPLPRQRRRSRVIKDASRAIPIEHRCGSIEMLPGRSKITSGDCRPGLDLKITELHGGVGVAARAVRFAQHGIDCAAIGTIDEQTDR